MRIPVTTPSPRTLALLALAPPVPQGATVVQLATPDQFAVVVAPAGRPAGVLVCLPGTSAHATASASHWSTHASRHKLALVTIQWWDGAAYLTPSEISDVALKLLSLLQVDTIPRVLHGHSRGGTQLYPLMGRAGGGHVPATGYLVECSPWEASWAPTMDAAGQRVVLVEGRGDVSRPMSASQAKLDELGAYTKLLKVGVNLPTDHGALTRERDSVDAALAFLLG